MPPPGPTTDRTTLALKALRLGLGAQDALVRYGLPEAHYWRVVRDLTAKGLLARVMDLPSARRPVYGRDASRVSPGRSYDPRHRTA